MRFCFFKSFKLWKKYDVKFCIYQCQFSQWRSADYQRVVQQSYFISKCWSPASHFLRSSWLFRPNTSRKNSDTIEIWEIFYSFRNTSIIERLIYSWCLGYQIFSSNVLNSNRKIKHLSSKTSYINSTLKGFQLRTS